MSRETYLERVCHFSHRLKSSMCKSALYLYGGSAQVKGSALLNCALDLCAC